MSEPIGGPLPRGLSLGVASLGVRAVVGTLSLCSRRQIATPERLGALRKLGEPAILLVWHHQIIMMAMEVPSVLIRRGVPVAVLISRSKEGDLGHRISVARGAEVVRGSSSRVSGAALRRLHRVLVGADCNTVVIPDGPRRPARRLKGGALTLARLTGAPIVPMAFVTDRCERLRSWDRTVVPMPFARIGVAVGEPWRLPRARESAGDEIAMDRLAGALDGLEDEARSTLASGRP